MSRNIYIKEMGLSFVTEPQPRSRKGRKRKIFLLSYKVQIPLIEICIAEFFFF